MIEISFHGAAGTVTGSKVLVEHEGRRFLVDCGLFQGLKQLRLHNWSALPVSTSSIDAVVLTHAHIDHSGFLPRLVELGFKNTTITMLMARNISKPNKKTKNDKRLTASLFQPNAAECCFTPRALSMTRNK